MRKWIHLAVPHTYHTMEFSAHQKSVPGPGPGPGPSPGPGPGPGPQVQDQVQVLVAGCGP